MQSGNWDGGEASQSSQPGTGTILVEAIKNYIDEHNQNPHVFVWTAPVERILAKINKCKEVLDALH